MLVLMKGWRKDKNVAPKQNNVVFQTSHRCNTSKKTDKCVEPTHFLLETTRQDAVRKGHHQGLIECSCTVKCFGNSVKY